MNDDEHLLEALSAALSPLPVEPSQVEFAPKACNDDSTMTAESKQTAECVESTARTNRICILAP